ncbi:MAG: hypothetical protein JNN15_17610, partial [Blastocatellia bacterium]|nr:hypothetical protein [Blastocatellia bacterium]
MLVDWIVPVNTVDWSFAVLKDFVRSDAAKGYVESFFSEHTSRLDKEYVERGLSKAIRELLQLVYDELLDNDLSRRELEDWKTDFKEFILTDGVRQALHEAFFNSRIYIDPQLFAKSWEQVSTDHILPESFSWERIAKRLGRAIERLKAEDPLLEKALNAESAHQVIGSQVLTSLNPVSSRELYREALLERYSSLSFQSFDATGIYYKTKIWSLFIPQNTRECDRYYTNVHEIPKEYRTKFFDDSELNYDFGEKVKKFHQDYVQQSTKLVTKVVEDDSTNRLVV